MSTCLCVCQPWTVRPAICEGGILTFAFPSQCLGYTASSDLDVIAVNSETTVTSTSSDYHTDFRVVLSMGTRAESLPTDAWTWQRRLCLVLEAERKLDFFLERLILDKPKHLLLWRPSGICSGFVIWEHWQSALLWIWAFEHFQDIDVSTSIFFSSSLWGDLGFHWSSLATIVNRGVSYFSSWPCWRIDVFWLFIFDFRVWGLVGKFEC